MRAAKSRLTLATDTEVSSGAPSLAGRGAGLDAQAGREGVEVRSQNSIYCVGIALGSVAAVITLEVAEYLAGFGFVPKLSAT
jgi:hypothetical protein